MNGRHAAQESGNLHNICTSLHDMVLVRNHYCAQSLFQKDFDLLAGKETFVAKNNHIHPLL